MNKRLVANRTILDVLTQYIEAHPDIRFSQALFNLGIVEFDSNVEHVWKDDYHLEPEEILERMPV